MVDYRPTMPALAPGLAIAAAAAKQITEARAEKLEGEKIVVRERHEPLHRPGKDVSRQMRRALARHDYKRRRARERRSLGWVARYVGDFRHGRPWQEALEASL